MAACHVYVTSNHWRCSVKGVLKLSQFSQETPVLESFSSKVAGLLWKFINLKRDSNTGFFCEVWEIFKNTYFEEHLRMTAFKVLFREEPNWLNKMRFIDIANTFHKDRSSRPKLFCKNLFFKKKFWKFTIKQLCRSLVLKKAARRWLIYKRLLHRYFPVNFTNFFRTHTGA